MSGHDIFIIVVLSLLLATTDFNLWLRYRKPDEIFSALIPGLGFYWFFTRGDRRHHEK